MRQRGYVLALAAVLCACTPAPGRMPAAQAAEVLNLFAAGGGPANVCSASGRALLRGAVRAYSNEMQRSGVQWPAVPGLSSKTGDVTAMDISVVIAFAAGFVKSNDFHGAPHLVRNQLSLAQWPEMRSMRIAAREACEETVALQQAAADFVIENTRYHQLNGHGGAEQLRRQSMRLRRAHERMQVTAAVIEARMQAHRL